MNQLFSRDTRYLILIVLIHLAACIETDIYLPAFPDMMDFFDTTEEMIQSILSWNFFGICIACPFYGPLSDAFGRRKLLISALGLFLLGSIGTVFSSSIHEMLAYRILQGLGSGGCFTVGAALIFDVWEGEKAVKVTNDLNCIIPVIMAIAPMIGGYLNYHYGFRSNFIAIAIFVLASFVFCLFFLEETHPVEKRHPFRLGSILADFGRAMTCWRFWAPTCMICLIFAGYLTYVSSIAILFVKHLGVDAAVFPYYQAALLMSFVAASLLANRVISKWGVETVKRRGLIMVFLGGSGFVLSTVFTADSPNLFELWMMLFSFGAGWTIGPFFGEGMESLPEIKGITSSLMTSLRLASTALMIGLTGRFFDGTIYPLAYVVIFVLVLGYLIQLGNRWNR